MISEDFYKSIQCLPLFERVKDAISPLHFTQLLLSGFPLEHFWRLCIDGVKADKDSWPGFEAREQGYLQGMYAVFASMLKEVNTPLNADSILKYHLKATNAVAMEKLPKDLKGKWRTEDASFGLLKSNATVEGIISLLNRLEDGDDEFVLARDNVAIEDEIVLEEYDIINCYTLKMMLDNKIDFLIRRKGMSADDPGLKECAKRLLAEFILKDNYAFRTQQHKIYKLNADMDGIGIEVSSQPIESLLHAKVEAIIQDYHKMIQTQDCDMKLMAIIDTIQKLEQLHPFKDANCRVFVMVLLNKLLLQNGFPMCILHDPNCFDAFSTTQLLTEVKTGMLTFQNVYFSQKKKNELPTTAVIELNSYFESINKHLSVQIQKILSYILEIPAKIFLPGFAKMQLMVTIDEEDSLAPQNANVSIPKYE
jgi:hypothetical protein